MKTTIMAVCLWLVVIAAFPAIAASPYSGNASRAVQWLVANQNGDGSWGATDDVKLPTTVEAVRALHTLNQRVPAYYWGITWLENHSAPNIDYEARRILALAPHGDNTQAGQAYIQAAQRLVSPGNSGWGLNQNYQGSPLDSAMALLACSQLGITANVQSALNYLKAAQLTGTDKGWAVAHESASDPLTTAYVVQALVSYQYLDATLSTPIANGVASLTTNVGTASPIHLQALAAATYLRAGYTSYATSLLNSIVSLQSADGGCQGSLLATALAARSFAASMATDLATLATVVYLPDANLRRAVNAALGRNGMDAINRGDMANLTTLNAVGMGISNLTGLEYAVNLTSADLRNNQITSTTQLAGLTQLTSVQLDGNPIAAAAVPAMSMPALLFTSVLLIAVNAFYSRRKRYDLEH